MIAKRIILPALHKETVADLGSISDRRKDSYNGNDAVSYCKLTKENLGSKEM
jgi:hypothetical protein